GCKKPSYLNENSALATNANGSWISLSSFRESNLDSNKRYILKFGATWCAPCKALEIHLPDIVKNIDPTKFVLVSIDIEQDSNGEALLKALISRDKKMNANYEAGQGDFKQGITLPWTIVIDKNFQPKEFLNGFNSQKLSFEKKRFENAL